MENITSGGYEISQVVNSKYGHAIREIEVWGTVVAVEAASSIATEAELHKGITEVIAYVNHIDEVFSTYKPDSIVSRLRRQEIQIADTSEEVKDVWNRCLFARDLTQGAFDPWAVLGGFDPSGLVKGLAADRCSEIMLDNGAEHVQINAAGDLALRGGYFNGTEVIPWSIGVVNPENRQEIVEVFEIMDGAIATSGTYERGAHILDPHTGLIAIGARSATVIGADGGLTDALATALMVEGRDGAIWFGNPVLAQYSAWVIDRNDDISWSLGPKATKP
ncbi:MAG: FAD:protein FMN transferase [Actinobacteria bacterium]|nr:FAD:protein FMN transferase [Actinomycetota bacterium]